jgi:hypothetical protein
MFNCYNKTNIIGLRPAWIQTSLRIRCPITNCIVPFTSQNHPKSRTYNDDGRTTSTATDDSNMSNIKMK